MVRFIVNFILYGILFYLIYLFFPDAFMTLVSWVNQAYEFLRDLGMQIWGKVQEWRGGSSHPAPSPSHERASLFLFWLRSLY